MRDEPESSEDNLGFSYRLRKSGDVEILRHGTFAVTLRGLQAQDFVAEAEAGAFSDRQQLMARVTGNYKRGNERTAGNHPRNRR